VTGSVLSVSEDKKDAPEVVSTDGEEPQIPHGDVIYMTEPLDRPEELEGSTYKIKWPDSEHALYITINDLVVGGHRRPFEVFINSKNKEHFAWTVALTRMISAVFRRGGDVSFVVEQAARTKAIAVAVKRGLKVIGSSPQRCCVINRLETM
jgi:ribonucleoside-diphosphate reductase alpha chain